MRKFWPPPHRTAYFCAVRSPGRFCAYPELRARSHDRIYIAASGGRRCRKELEEVEGTALTRENGPGQACDFKESLIRSNAVAVVGMPGQLDSGIQLTEYLSHPRAAAQGRLLAGDDFTCDPLRGGDQLAVISPPPMSSARAVVTC